MTNLNKFAAQQLTKKQMNEVTGGGVRTNCLLELDDGTLVELGEIDRSDFLEVERELNAVYGGFGSVSCIPWLL